MGGAGLAAKVGKAGKIAKSLSSAAAAVDPLAQTAGLVGKVAQKVISPFSNAVKSNVSKIAKERGLDHPASILTNKSLVRMTEAISSKGLL